MAGKTVYGGLYMRNILILLVVMLTFTAACGKKEVKQVSEDSKTAVEAFALIETLKDAYIKKDMKAIEKNATKDGYRSVLGAMKNFDAAELTFNPVFVEIEEGVVNVNVSWKGSWKKDGKPIDERGMAVFVFKERPLKLDNILRANPFKYPE